MTPNLNSKTKQTKKKFRACTCVSIISIPNPQQTDLVLTLINGESEKLASESLIHGPLRPVEKKTPGKVSQVNEAFNGL